MSWNMKMLNIENFFNYCNMNNFVWYDYRYIGYSGYIKGFICVYLVSVGVK